jgi:Glycosyl hydrolase catalytic core
MESSWTLSGRRTNDSQNAAWAEGFGRPIWITEFGCLNASAASTDVVRNFYLAAIAMLKGHATVERYAWYPWATTTRW